MGTLTRPLREPSILPPVAAGAARKSCISARAAVVGFCINTHPDDGSRAGRLEGCWSINPIKDEYGRSISAAEMERIVEHRPPFGGRALSRHEIDGRLCLAHGGRALIDIMREIFMTRWSKRTPAPPCRGLRATSARCSRAEHRVKLLQEQAA